MLDVGQIACLLRGAAKELETKWTTQTLGDKRKGFCALGGIYYVSGTMDYHNGAGLHLNYGQREAATADKIKIWRKVQAYATKENIALLRRRQRAQRSRTPCLKKEDCLGCQMAETIALAIGKKYVSAVWRWNDRQTSNEEIVRVFNETAQKLEESASLPVCAPEPVLVG